MNRSNTLVISAVLALAIVGEAGLASAQFNVCNHNFGGTAFPLRINWSHSLHRSTVGNGGGDTASWPANVIDGYHRGWEGWWYLNTANPAVWMPGTTNGAGYWGISDAEIVHRATFLGPGLLGQAIFPNAWPSNWIEHVDIYVNGPTTGTPAGNPAVMTNPFQSNSCVFTNLGNRADVVSTEVSTLIHELGHGYGYAHLDGWLSPMNANAPFITDCELGTGTGAGFSMWTIPSAAGVQCHDILYGIPAGVDLALTPFFTPASGCAGNVNLPGCKTIDVVDHPAFTVPYPASRLFITNFSTLNNLDAVVGPVRFRFLLSTDRTVSAGDTIVADFTSSTGFTQGATTRRTFLFSVSPAADLPLVNTFYNFLVQIDPLNVIAETRETNNVIDTGLRFRRLP